MVNNGLVVFYW